ncbi:MAG: cobalamin B12-binding domain-containing protein, partial [Pseudomonadota bacterium]|nr:cobalamin B12-binding domain-containing protein [Pseudomonadota bacterium]
MDVLFVNPDSSAKAYQGLAKVYSAIEPPTWALLLAESCRSKGFGVGILDCDAERLSLEESVLRIEELRPRLIVFV